MIFNWLKGNKDAPKRVGNTETGEGNPPGSHDQPDGMIENAVALAAGMEMANAYYPGHDPIDYYGNGGFRFGEMSHQGALLFLPSGIHRWDVATLEDVTKESLLKLFAEASDIEILLIGTGSTMQRLDSDITNALRAEGIKLEALDTGAAVRTLNILLSEGRAVAAAMLPVD